jgi:hypothetical protein
MRKVDLKKIIKESIGSLISETEYYSKLFESYEDEIFCEEENIRLSSLLEEKKLPEGEFVINKPNSKLVDIPSFNIPAGWTCPGADLCMAKIKKGDDGSRNMEVGKSAALKCFAANLEQRYPAVYNAVQHNFRVLKDAKSAEQIARKLIRAIKKADFVKNKFRIHVHGDFLNKEYFDAWRIVANYMPRIQFYAYTKSIHLLPKKADDMPSNFNITLSMGGKFDKRTDDMEGYHKAHIVKTKEEADNLGLEIDYDDSLANSGNKSFALLLHGGQIAGTENSKLVTFYNWLTPKLKSAGASITDVKRIKAKMRVADIVTKILPDQAEEIYSRIHRSKLSHLFDDIPSKQDLSKFKNRKKTPIDPDKLKRVIDKLPKSVVNKLEDIETEEDLMSAILKIKQNLKKF